jgi:hypothetical protein
MSQKVENQELFTDLIWEEYGKALCGETAE